MIDIEHYERVRLCVQKIVKHGISYHKEGSVEDSMVHSLTMSLLGGQIRTTVTKQVPVPATWWEHFKLDAFRGRLNVRYEYISVPVEYVQNVCPHHNVDFRPGQNDVHFSFLREF